MYYSSTCERLPAMALLIADMVYCYWRPGDKQAKHSDYYDLRHRTLSSPTVIYVTWYILVHRVEIYDNSHSERMIAILLLYRCCTAVEEVLTLRTRGIQQ